MPTRFVLWQRVFHFLAKTSGRLAPDSLLVQILSPGSKFERYIT